MKSERDLPEMLSLDERPEVFDEGAIPATMNLDAAIDAGLPVDSHTTVMTVDFRSGEAVHLHPRIAPMLRDGWMLRRAVPKFIDGTVQLLVTMRRRERALS
jgi:hypothetical protein